MQVHILLSTARSDNHTQIENAYTDFKEAQKDMRERFESSKKFWEGIDTTQYQEVHIGCYDSYAEAYAIDEDYEETGMSWTIETITVK